MNTVLYSFQVERISFFENDNQVSLEVRFLNDPLHFSGELILTSSQLNLVVNEFYSCGYDIMECLESKTTGNGSKYYEIDLREEINLPIFDMPHLLSEQGAKQIRA
jgi:hypothetical protein